MHREQQEALIAEPHRARVWCKGIGCGRELTDPVSRQRQLGPECDPEPRTGDGRRHHVDQEPLPGL